MEVALHGKIDPFFFQFASLCEIQPMMPYPYAVECVCDKLAATRVYAGKDYSSDLPLKHWLKYGNKVPANEKTLKFAEEIFIDVEKYGEKYVLNKKYMKEKYQKVCING